MLSKQAIEEFQNIYLKTYGRDISYEEAAKLAAQVLRLHKAVLEKSEITRMKSPKPEGGATM